MSLTPWTFAFWNNTTSCIVRFHDMGLCFVIKKYVLCCRCWIRSGLGRCTSCHGLTIRIQITRMPDSSESWNATGIAKIWGNPGICTWPSSTWCPKGSCTKEGPSTPQNGEGWSTFTKSSWSSGFRGRNLTQSGECLLLATQPLPRQFKFNFKC